MLPLTPMPLQTAGERAFFAELARWDTGGAVRGAVVASLPLTTDGPLQRRASDAVLFVPEGLAVVRVAEVVRQSGVVTASADGPWTIGPGGGPGDVLQLGGGGSTPLDGLMRAGMDAAVRLRRAGLEPGRIARLTVLVGEISGLIPADGDLGEGDQVALCDPRSLLLGIARASRYAGVDNPRLWTTADVRAALEALGLQGRGPSVEELNGEGFPYSPYVLRRPELLTPASMSAAPVEPRPVAAPVATVSPLPAPAPAVVPPSLPPQPVLVPPVPQPAAAQLTATQVAMTPNTGTSNTMTPNTGTSNTMTPNTGTPSTGDPFAGVPARDTIDASVAVREPIAPVAIAPVVISPEPEDTDGGLGGLFASADAVFPTDAVQEQPPTGTAVLTAPAWGETPAAWGAPPEVPAAMSPRAPSGSRRGLLVAVLAVVALVVVLGGAALVVSGLHRDSAKGTTVARSVPAAPTLQKGRVQQVGGTAFRLEQAQADSTCVDHAYGQVAGFFGTNDCTGLSRALYSVQIDGHAAVAAISRVRMADPAGARSLRALADRSGTGNVDDLLREGVRYDGGPQKLLPSAEYASALAGSVVTIVETSWVDAAAAGPADQLDAAANTGLQLDVLPFPGR